MLDPKYKSTNSFNFIVILIGDVRVGKTSFLYSATGKSQNSIQPTMGIDFMSTSVPLHGKLTKIEIWDTSTFRNEQSRCINIPINNIDLLQKGTRCNLNVRYQQQGDVRKHKAMESGSRPKSKSFDK
jgi:GTPase SAR1 family protein